jgi:hypothetical protein
MDLDKCSQMIIFESFLTTFKASIVFRGGRGSNKNWLKLEIEPLYANLACLNWGNTL